MDLGLKSKSTNKKSKRKLERVENLKIKLYDYKGALHEYKLTKFTKYCIQHNEELSSAILNICFGNILAGLCKKCH